MTAPSEDWLLVDELAPATTGTLAPLYERAESGQLVMPFCTGCAASVELEQVVCDRCDAPAAWQVVEPAGTVHATTTVHRREPGLVRSDQPYHVVDVELHSGHRVVMTTSAPLAQAPAIGQPVVVVFRRIGTVAVPAVSVSSSHISSPLNPEPEVRI